VAIHPGTHLGPYEIESDGKVELHDGDRICIGPILVYYASASGMSTETISHTAGNG
jgi:hypothetical protein